jgi:hypothetical protein
MQFTLAAALLAFAGAALAQVEGFDAITSPPKDTTMKAGATFEIVWEPAPTEFDNELIDILLLAGSSPSTLNVVDTPIATGLKNSVGKFSWDVPAELGDQKTYGIKIELQSDPETFQFSFPFAITPAEGGSKPNSTTSAKPKTSSTTSSSASEQTSASSKAKTTLYTTVDDSAAAATGTKAPTSKTSVGFAPQATAGAFALVGGFAIAAIGL